MTNLEQKVILKDVNLKEFLWERKTKLLDVEKRATGRNRDIIFAQIQVIDAMFIFLSSQQEDADMAKLKLTLDKQPTSIEELKPRQENAELTEALVELANQLKPGTKVALNNLPSDVKPKSVSSKIYGLRKSGKLPSTVKPIQRGEELYLVKLKDGDGH